MQGFIMIRVLLLVFILTGVSACGVSGNLELPEGESRRAIL
jgi:predicted small lipoprotein YifL